MSTRTRPTRPPQAPASPRRIAIIGAGLSGIACARTLLQAGHHVQVFEANAAVGGRMASADTAYGTFDHGAQYFTVRDARFALALEQTAPGVCKPWSANAVRVLDPYGRVAAAALPTGERHWVPSPGMQALPNHWAEPLQVHKALELHTRVTGLTPDRLQAQQWQLTTVGMAGDPDAQRVFGGFDDVVLAVPAAQALKLLRDSALAPALQQRLSAVSVGPCWTLLLAFPQAQQAKPVHLGPQWNAARSTHHRVAWLARENSKPGRGRIERWTVQASTAWSAEHLHDDAARVQVKLRKAFAEITGIRAEPTFAATHVWRQAQTLVPLGVSHVWDDALRIGVAGDWCIGHRIEDAFVSGLELALAMA
jgi:renalase